MIWMCCQSENTDVKGCSKFVRSYLQLGDLSLKVQENSDVSEECTFDFIFIIELEFYKYLYL